MSAADLAVLSPEAVTALRDAGPKDLLWLICDSHELLRARCEQLERERDEAQLIALERCPCGNERRVAELEAALRGIAEQSFSGNDRRIARAALEAGS